MKETVIDPRELRIGNFLLYKGEVVHVTTLSLDVDDECEETIGFCKIGHGHNEHADWNRALYPDLKGIPISTEWLERCGFIDKGPNDAAKSTWLRENIYCPSFDSFEGAFYCSDDWGAQHFAYCEYIHQLQNAVYALTGTELEIKPL